MNEFLILIMFPIFIKLILWVLKPICNIVDNKNQIIKDSPTEIIIKKGQIDSSKIIPYNKETAIKKFTFRPQTLEQYIGQDRQKEKVRLNIEKIRTLKPVHFLLSGSAGHGKTTMAYIIKNMLNSEIVEFIGSQINNPEQVVEIANKINQSSTEFPVLFIDEIHNVSTDLCENFYSMMEDYRLLGKSIKPFILIGATTRKDDMIRRVKPFVDRFQAQITLEKYEVNNIKDILLQVKNQLYPDKKILMSDIETISYNCRLTPRIGISLLEDVIVKKDIQEVLKCNRIVYNGLTDIDIKLLNYLKEVNKPIGEEAISQILGLDRSDYKILIEPYLIEQRFITRGGKGRLITPLGISMLRGIK